MMQQVVAQSHTPMVAEIPAINLLAQVLSNARAEAVLIAQQDQVQVRLLFPSATTAAAVTVTMIRMNAVMITLVIPVAEQHGTAYSAMTAVHVHLVTARLVQHVVSPTVVKETAECPQSLNYTATEENVVNAALTVLPVQPPAEQNSVLRPVFVTVVSV